MVSTFNYYDAKGWRSNWVTMPHNGIDHPFELINGTLRCVYGLACQLPTLGDNVVAIGINSPYGGYLRTIDTSAVNTGQREATTAA